MKNTPASITQARRARAQMAEIAALRRENDRLQDPELPEYVLLCGTIIKGMGLTANQRIDLARSMHEFAGSRDEPMCLDMCETFFEYWEGRARARVAESEPRPTAIVLAWPHSTTTRPEARYKQNTQG